jgi:hypothetical protein
MMIVNPGSGPIAAGKGWVNTYEGARPSATAWHAEMLSTGMEVDLLLPGEKLDDGRWMFGFRHRVTGVVVELTTHGIDNLDAYRKERVFDPRVYWNGSSSADPKLEDWAAPGFRALRTYVAVEGT